MSTNFSELQDHILSLSESDSFIIAKSEWYWSGVEIHEDFTTCPCGQPIKEVCHITNRLNNNETFVGNICINQFMDIETGCLFDGLNRIKNDKSANANEDVINYAFKFGYLYEKEYKFLLETKRKRKLSDKQQAWKEKINWRILNQVVVKKS